MHRKCQFFYCRDLFSFNTQKNTVLWFKIGTPSNVLDRSVYQCPCCPWRTNKGTHNVRVTGKTTGSSGIHFKDTLLPVFLFRLPGSDVASFPSLSFCFVYFEPRRILFKFCILWNRYRSNLQIVIENRIKRIELIKGIMGEFVLMRFGCILQLTPILLIIKNFRKLN